MVALLSEQERNHLDQEARIRSALCEDAILAIHFVCVCGKHLKSRRDMAGRVTLCPACGEHVKIPSEEPTHRGASRVFKAAPLPTAADCRSHLPEVLFRGERRSALARHREQPERGWMGSFVYTLPFLP